MLAAVQPPLVRLGNLFPNRQVFAKCEFLAPAGSFKIRGALHLLDGFRQAGPVPPLVVPSMGNTALGCAVAARALGVAMVGVVPATLSRDKDDKLKALGVELVKVPGGGSELLRTARQLADERQGYFVHPHLDARWTDGYQAIVAEVLEALPDCRSLVFPLGGGGLLMGLTEYLARRPARLALHACEAYNFPTYARYEHARSPTVAEGLVLDDPHPQVQERIAEAGVHVHLVTEEEIRANLRELFTTQGLVIEPSSVVPIAFVRAHDNELEEPIALVLTGENITRDDFWRLIGPDT
jgi:threonine dehydratase